MEIGSIASVTVTVDSTNVAGNLGSGDLDVFATPSMVAKMEAAAAKCVAPFLEEGQSTVGTRVEINHTAATPVGMQVTCYAQLTGLEGKILQFKVWAEDECGSIGEGLHTRAVIFREKFLQRTNEKRTAK